MNPVYLTSDNMITSLGFTSETHWEQLWQGETGIKEYQPNQFIEVPYHASLVNEEILEHQFSSLNTDRPFTRLEKMFLVSISKAVENLSIDLSSKKTLFIVSTTKGNIDLIENLRGFDQSRLKLGAMAHSVSQFFNNPNQPVVISNACISGVVAIIMANRMLRTGHYENVVVTGGDLVTPFTLSGFNCLKALSHAPCRPFDANRKGINLGEGVGTMILSKEKFNDKSIEVYGGAISNDANHISGPSRTGEGLQIAIKNALKASNSSVSIEDIGFISAHGTATLFNDEMEAKAFNALEVNEVATNSMKGYWGHTLGAAGVLESIMTCHSLKNQGLISSVGYEESGVSLPLNVITKSKSTALKAALKTSSGFGGCNAAVIFKSPLHD